MDWWLVLEGTSDKSSETAFAINEGSTVLGRDKSSNVVLLGAQISRKHACIERRGDTVEIRDLGSTLGTAINGKTVEFAVLEKDDIVRIGSSKLRLSDELPTPGPARPIPEGADDGAAGADWRPFRSFLEKMRKSASPKETLEELLSGLVDLLKAERGFILLDDESGGPLVPVAQHNLSDSNERTVISKTVCKKVIDKQSTLIILDSANDSLCLKASSLAVADKPRTVVCGPLISGARTIGVAYLDMPRAGNPITQAQRNLFDTIIGLAAELTGAKRTRTQLLAARGRVEALSELSLQDHRLVMGDGEESNKLKTLIQAAAEQDIAVLITGDTGTGKEMVARALHRLSPRSHGPFVPVHCAALPRDIIEAELFGVKKGAFTGADENRMGRFELASGGTIFLDEIGELPLDFQVKLLRVLQERVIRRLGDTKEIKLDLRLVCATNVNVEQAVREGSLRQDLYYRINVFRIELPSLTNRKDSIMPLANYFLSQFATRCAKNLNGFTPEAKKLLQNYAWPGNVRELKNAIERAVVIERGTTIRAESLPIGSAQKAELNPNDMVLQDMPEDFETAKNLFEKTFLERTLALNEGNVRAIARNAGIPRTSLYRLLTKHSLSGKKA